MKFFIKKNSDGHFCVCYRTISNPKAIHLCIKNKSYRYVKLVRDDYERQHGHDKDLLDT